MLLQHVDVSAVDSSRLLFGGTIHFILYMWANLLKAELVSWYIPVATVWVKIVAPNCHGKGRYDCDMKRFSVTI